MYGQVVLMPSLHISNHRGLVVFKACFGQITLATQAALCEFAHWIDELCPPEASSKPYIA